MPHKDFPIRPLVRAFDPVGPDTLGPPDLDFASLFREKNVPEDAPLTLYPEQLGVPWHTSLPWVRQSKWWVQGEAAGRDLVNRISADKASERGTLPVEFMDERRKGKIDELVEDAVSCAVYLYPSSSPTRIELLTQALLLLFFHDDVMERGATQDETTVVDEFVTMKPKNKHMKRYFNEVMECDPILGPGLLRAIGLFVNAGRKKSPFKQDKYVTLAEYLDYRRHDIAKPFMIAAIRFGTGVHHTPEEVAPFAELEDLYVQHSILMNDLYSYDKEIYEARTINGSVVNTVHVIEKLMCVPPHLAKTITRTMSFDVEKKYYAESEKFMRDPSLNDKQHIPDMRMQLHAQPEQKENICNVTSRVNTTRLTVSLPSIVRTNKPVASLAVSTKFIQGSLFILLEFKHPQSFAYAYAPSQEKVIV
ncbi:Aristolochene synthase [Fusarium acutatum]|uniref:Aristolochene synthase n=1 Tax=Fusarium acutatum TaxID=78861 RepID=A0A8H4JS82_9HYPO|nr:Aristolochene synthase [Fusarium acutatum]